MTLAFEALTIGGVIFQFAIAPKDLAPALHRKLSAFLIGSASLLGLAQVGYVAANSAILMESTGLTWDEVSGAAFCISGALMFVGAVLVAVGKHTRMAGFCCPGGCVLILTGAVMSSHSMGRMDHRLGLAVLTLAHHAAGAAWIGGLPYLLISLKGSPAPELAAALLNRFSRMAMASVAVLLSAGGAMSILYVGSVTALLGTAYGIMILSKVMLTGLVLALGALNFRTTRAIRNGVAAGLLQLRRFGEVEVGIGITVILAAASLTSSPPAIDMQADHVSIAEITKRMSPHWPRIRTPQVKELSAGSPLTPLSNSISSGSFVPGQRTTVNTPADIAWSEYNHHWAGLMVLAIGILSLLARRLGWARSWPLVFVGLAIFLFIRADAENWPLGPHGFWESFRIAEVAQHRLFVLLIVAFAAFEWRVQTSNSRVGRTGLVFPMVCAAGGALLFTHSHSLGNVKEEFLAELSHLPIAILAVAAGWSRWLELRLSPGESRIALREFVPWIWPLCFILIGTVLLNYREA
jgi:putative copper resistance protein D